MKPPSVAFTSSLNPYRTTKVRLVFDALAQGREGKSLNDHLEKGPNYINSLPNVFIAWRFHEEAHTSDVPKISVQPSADSSRWPSVSSLSVENK